MGAVFSELNDLFESLENTGTTARICILGLNNAGKTTILYKVKQNEVVATVPTVGFNVETVEPVEGVSFTVWDVGGGDTLRSLWSKFLHSNEGLLYVVDSSDRERVAEAAAELHSILSEDSMCGVPVVVLANKQDLPGVMSPAELVQRMGLTTITNKWHMQGTCGTSGDGLYKGMEALARMIKETQQKNEEDDDDFWSL